ncbi:adipocyte plasma membrane-associated protein isoform X2 [Lepisosteus oculatus]|uniref:adipocyte plasma membrane-associated protein isoform X2 n=1 Tax=Lepisosteus oculatus TaxID=7918 RepID=UPI0035F5229B
MTGTEHFASLLLILPSFRVDTYSGRVFRLTLLTLAALLLVPLLVAILLLESPIQPQRLSFSEPPLMSGCLEPNFKLRQAERLFEGQLIGPESIANIGDVLYTGTADGKIVKIEGNTIHVVATLGRPPCGSRDDEPTCGRPLGIRVGLNGTLFVADAYLGLFEVNPVTGAVDTLVSTRNPVAGRRLSFVNDLDVTRDGRKIFFTDSSSKWPRRDYSYLIMEGTDDGRLLEYDTVTREVSVLLDGLRFPNGVQLSPNEDFVLVAETTMARIRRCHVSGLQKGGMETFAENLPGFPDNIRRSSSGGYWVSMSAVRPNPGFSMLDFLADKPWVKKMIFKILSQEVLMKFVPKYSLVVELSESAACKRSFHDPHGVVATYISEAHEHDGHLYLGSFRSPFLCRLDLSQLPFVHAHTAGSAPKQFERSVMLSDAVAAPHLRFQPTTFQVEAFEDQRPACYEREVPTYYCNVE